MLHRHVEALLDKRAIGIDIATRANDSLCACAMIDATSSFGSESFFAGVEDDGKVLVARLIHCLGSLRILLALNSILVETGAWHFKLQALAVEHLVVVEARRGCIEADTFASNRLIVTGSCAMLSPDVLVLDASYLVFNSKDCLLVIDVLSMFTLCDNLGALASIASEDTNAWVLCRVGHVKTIDS